MPAQKSRNRAQGRASGQSSRRSVIRGGTLLGFMIGLVVGLGIAVVVAVFVTRAPVPFVNKAGRASDRVLQPRTPADAPDPNTPLYSKNQPAAPQPPGAQPPPDARGGSLLERIFGRRSSDAEAPQGADGSAPVIASRPATLPAVPAVKGEAAGRDQTGGPATDAAAGRISYLLQAGAFRGRDEADGMRAKLALLGFEAQVLNAEVNGETMYRVRVGPFGQLEDMNTARARLADNGIEASVVRQR